MRFKLPLELLLDSPPNSGYSENPTELRDIIIGKLGIVFSNKIKKSGFIILDKRKGKLLNCREIGKIHMR